MEDFILKEVNELHQTCLLVTRHDISDVQKYLEYNMGLKLGYTHYILSHGINQKVRV